MQQLPLCAAVALRILELCTARIRSRGLAGENVEFVQREARAGDSREEPTGKPVARFMNARVLLPTRVPEPESRPPLFALESKGSREMGKSSCVRVDLSLARAIGRAGPSRLFCQSDDQEPESRALAAKERGELGRGRR